MSAPAVMTRARWLPIVLFSAGCVVLAGLLAHFGVDQLSAAFARAKPLWLLGYLCLALTLRFLLAVRWAMMRCIRAYKSSEYDAARKIVTGASLPGAGAVPQPARTVTPAAPATHCLRVRSGLADKQVSPLTRGPRDGCQRDRYGALVRHHRYFRRGSPMRQQA